MNTMTDTRTPLWQMTDAQLRFIAGDDLTEWDRKFTAIVILENRAAMAEQEDDGA